MFITALLLCTDSSNMSPYLILINDSIINNLILKYISILLFDVVNTPAGTIQIVNQIIIIGLGSIQFISAWAVSNSILSIRSSMVFWTTLKVFKELFYLIEEDIQSSIIYFEIKFEANQHRFVYCISNEIFQCRIHIVLDKENLRKSRLKWSRRCHSVSVSLVYCVKMSQSSLISRVRQKASILEDCLAEFEQNDYVLDYVACCDVLRVFVLH